MTRFIYINGTRLYHYDNYHTWREAYKMALYHKHKHNSRFFILKKEVGWFNPTVMYSLYMNKIIKLNRL